MKDTLRLQYSEEWKRYENSSYLFSNYGRVQNSSTLKMLKPFINSAGYLRIDLRLNGKTIPVNVHRAVAELFVDGYEEGKVVNHKDGNKLNSYASNLEWISQSENVKHAYDIGLREGSNKHGVIAINIKTEEAISFDSISEASKFTGADRSSIYKILNGKQKSSKGFTFANNDIR